VSKIAHPRETGDSIMTALMNIWQFWDSQASFLWQQQAHSHRENHAHLNRIWAAL
jgi:hypothetical protein